MHETKSTIVGKEKRRVKGKVTRSRRTAFERRSRRGGNERRARTRVKPVQNKTKLKVTDLIALHMPGNVAYMYSVGDMVLTTMYGPSECF